MTTPALILVGTPIGNLGDLAPRAVDALRDADTILAEDTRRTRALLTHAGVRAGGRLRAVHSHNEAAEARGVVDEIRGGARVALVTDAGMPGVSDPGARLVTACLDAALPVEVVPGPSAVLTALVVSGLPTDRFVFEGFLPRRGRARRARLADVAAELRTVVLFEAPHRLAASLAELAVVCGPDRPVVLARELTKAFEDVWRGTLGDAPAHLETKPPRGEFVLVLGGRPGVDADVDDVAVETAVRDALDDGCSTRDAAALVAAELGIPKRRAYDAALRRELVTRRAPRS